MPCAGRTTAIAALLLSAVVCGPAQGLSCDEPTPLSRRLANEWQARRGPAFQSALEADSAPMRRLLATPGLAFSHLDERGQPVFLATENLNAARTLGTSELWPGGGAGLNLTGSGIDYLGMWDDGAVLADHQEFGNRVTAHETGATSDHSTHVAGILVAAGVEAAARGMAGQAGLHTWNWFNDAAEMASAAAGGMRVSNHSYGLVSGWYRTGGEWYWYGDPAISPVEAYRFGFYGNVSQDHDAIASAYPEYLIVESAGNDRDDVGPAPGGLHYVWDSGWVQSTAIHDRDGGLSGYDCIGSDKCAKNSLTIGSVADIPLGYTSPGDVLMTAYSNWGPTDDGRIKPDLVANGAGLYSSRDGFTEDYQSLSGTSMASANAAGSIALLNQHFQNRLGVIPRAATMKGLVIHTAGEAGIAAGPDYRHGWGLLDARAAADLISLQALENGHIQERRLPNQTVDTLPVVVLAGAGVCVTLSWTDLPGTPAAPSLDPPDPMLVHDLDIRLVSPSGVVHQPWILDPAIPAAPALHGDNTRDNVEQIRITATESGLWTIRVSHKGTIADQDYSLILDGAVALPCNNPIPVAPLVSITIQDGDVVLSWPAITESVAGCPLESVQYGVWRSEAGGASSRLAGSTMSTTFTDGGAAVDGAVGWYHVVAYSGLGNVGPAPAPSGESTSARIP